MRLLPILFLAGCALGQTPMSLQPEAARKIVFNALVAEKQPKPTRLRLIITKPGEEARVIPPKEVIDPKEETVVMLLPSQLHIGRTWKPLGKNDLTPLTNAITFAGDAIPGSGNQYQAFVCAASDNARTVHFQLVAPGHQKAIETATIRIEAQRR